MKKYLLALAIFILPIAASAQSVTIPASGSTSIVNYTTASLSDWVGQGGTWEMGVYNPAGDIIDVVYDPTAGFECGVQSGNMYVDVGQNLNPNTCAITTPNTLGTYTFIFDNDQGQNNGACGIGPGGPNLATAEACLTAAGVSHSVSTYVWSTPPPPVNGVQTLIDNANAGFLAATDPTIQTFTSGMGDFFLKPWLGSGLALLYELRFWILALIIIQLIVFFSYRAFAFFRR